MNGAMLWTVLTVALQAVPAPTGDGTTTTILAGVISALIAALVWMVKADRSDAQADKRRQDAVMDKLTDALGEITPTLRQVIDHLDRVDRGREQERDRQATRRGDR